MKKDIYIIKNDVKTFFRNVHIDDTAINIVYTFTINNLYKNWLTVEKIKKQTGIKDNNITQLMKEEIGINISSLISFGRAITSKKIIEKGYTVTKASQAVGYTCPSSITKIHYKYFNKPPSSIENIT